MAELTLKQVSAAVGGRLEAGAGTLPIHHYLFDTRDLAHPHSLFFALKSERANGHSFLEQMRRQPGCAAVVARDARISGDLPRVRVDDPLEAAHRLTAWARSQWGRVRFAGVTGSAGKTTTKEFLYQLLSARFHAFRSLRNWNNWIGLPFSMLQMKGDEDAAVFELAMSNPGIGEISRLAKLLRPDTAVILNALPVHLEYLGTVANVAVAKGEILEFLEADGCAVVNGDCRVLDPILDRFSGRILRFGRDAERNDVVLDQVERFENDTILKTRWWGREAEFHTETVQGVQVENLFAAMVTAHQMGLKHDEIRMAMGRLRPVPGRGVVRRSGRFTIVDETYNSNPEAVKQVLQWVDRGYNQRKIAVLGDMLELGPEEERFHLEVGAFWAGLTFDALIAVGPRGEWIARGAVDAGVDPSRVHMVADARTAGRALKERFPDPCVVVFKASRGVGLERAITELEDE